MIVDGVELLRLIRDGEIIENKTKIIDMYSKEEYIYDGNNIRDNGYCNLLDKESDSNFIRKKFEILSEEDEEMEIEAIEPIKFLIGSDENDSDIALKVNELIKAVKQLNSKIKGE